MHIKKNEIEAYIDSKRQEILNKWEYLVNLEGNNTEKEDMDIIANWLYREFTEAGVCCELRVAHEKSGKVLVGTAGADRPEKPIVFSGHYDTVFQKGQLGNHPFHIQDGVAYGPGVLDMKGGIVITLYVIKALEELGYDKRPIKIIFCGDEEGGVFHHYANAVMKEYAAGAVCGFNMETGRIDNRLCIGRKGALMGKFKISGVAAHSGCTDIINW